MKKHGRQKHIVLFEPSGRSGCVSKVKIILEAAQELGVDHQNVCGGQARSVKCKVLIIEECQEQHGIVSRIENLSPMKEGE